MQHTDTPEADFALAELEEVLVQQQLHQLHNVAARHLAHELGPAALEVVGEAVATTVHLPITNAN